MEEEIMFLLRTKKRSIAIFISFIIICSSSASSEELWPQKWWPSKWGADDQKGAFNTITPEKVKSALELVSNGKVYRLGMVYDSKMPLFGNRTFSLTIPGLPTGGPLGKNGVVWNDEFVVGELGQIVMLQLEMENPSR
jgi:hypothetical protein